MSSILNSSMMTNLGNLVQLGQDAVKAARQAVKGLGQDSKYFASTKKGEVSELRNELASPDLDVMKDAVKKVIAAITVGKDMNALFPDVVNCMRTGESRAVVGRCCTSRAGAPLAGHVGLSLTSL